MSDYEVAIKNLPRYELQSKIWERSDYRTGDFWLIYDRLPLPSWLLLLLTLSKPDYGCR